jgi:hypothetical protein
VTHALSSKPARDSAWRTADKGGRAMSRSLSAMIYPESIGDEYPDLEPN